MGQRVTRVIQIVFERVSLAEPYEMFCELTLDVLQLLEHRRDVHVDDAVVVGAGAAPSPEATFVSRTAAALTVGCFETGSHAVSVSSLAAVAVPSGPTAL